MRHLVSHFSPGALAYGLLFSLNNGTGSSARHRSSAQADPLISDEMFLAFTSQPGPQMNLLCVKLSSQNKGAGKRLLLNEGRCFFPVWIESIMARREEVRYMSHLAHLHSALETLILLTHP